MWLSDVWVDHPTCICCQLSIFRSVASSGDCVQRGDLCGCSDENISNWHLWYIVWVSFRWLSNVRVSMCFYICTYQLTIINKIQIVINHSLINYMHTFFHCPLFDSEVIQKQTLFVYLLSAFPVGMLHRRFSFHDNRISLQIQK